MFNRNHFTSTKPNWYRRCSTHCLLFQFIYVFVRHLQHHTKTHKTTFPHIHCGNAYIFISLACLLSDNKNLGDYLSFSPFSIYNAPVGDFTVAKLVFSGIMQIKKFFLFSCHNSVQYSSKVMNGGKFLLSSLDLILF